LIPELEILRKKFRERMNEVADKVATGSCADFGEYQKLCGVIEGLAYAERDLFDLAETMEKAQNE
jgi:hypothetical protein